MKGDRMDRITPIDYMAFRDNFAVTREIDSILLSGKPELCPNPFLSIVIPTFRRPVFLKLALDSALNQKNAGVSYEVVVVDNEPPGEATSQTEEVIAKYDVPNLLYYRNTQNLGIAGNWNRCAQLARGRWIAYLHDDDLLLPDYVWRMTRLLHRRNNIGGIMALAFELCNEGSLQEAMDKSRSRLSILYDTISRNKLMRLRRTDSHFKIANAYGAPTCGSVFRKDLLLASGGFDERFHPSFDWFLLYRFSGQHRLYRSMERLGYYRVLVNVSLSDKTKEAFLRDRLSFVHYASDHTKLGRVLRKLFENEQNNEILLEEYTDYEGKKAEDYFTPSTLRERQVRKVLYKILTNAYWKLKSYLCLIFG